MSPSADRRTRRGRGDAGVNERTPVLIVGAGPVGLALAGELGWRGIACTLIEKTDGAIEQPRMDIVGPRTMEFCRRWGIADWVRDAPYPGDYPQDCVYVTGLDGYELGRERFPGRAQEQCPPQSPQKRERVPQDMFDPILRRFVETFPHVRLRYGAELTSFEETAGGVVAQVRDVATGETRDVAADYLVGTDGGASLVRERAGITMSGNPALTYTTNVMLRCADFTSLHDKGTGLPFHLRRARGHLAHHRGDQRRRALPHVDRRLRRQGDPYRGRHPPCADARRGPRVRLRDPVGDAVGAARARRRQLRDAAGVHCRRCRAPDVADRRLRHEHRHPGCRRSRLEARGDPARLGRQRAAAFLRNRAPAGGRAQRHRSELESRAHARHPPAPAARRDLPGRAGRRRRARGVRALVHRDDAARVVHARLPPRLPLRQLAHRLRRRHAGAAASDRELCPDRAAGRACAARVAARRTLHARSVRARVRAAAARVGMRPMPRACGARQRRPAFRST